MRMEKISCFLNCKCQNISYCFSLKFDFQRFWVKSLPITGLTASIHWGKKMHFYFLYSITITIWTTSFFGIKRKSPRSISAKFSIITRCKYLSYIGKYACIGCGIWSRSFSDRGLINNKNLVKIVYSCYFFMCSYWPTCSIKSICKMICQYIIYKRGFSRTWNSGNNGKTSNREWNWYILEVMMWSIMDF